MSQDLPATMVYEVNNAEDVFSTANSLFSQGSPTKPTLIFRGVGDAENHQLIPTIFREGSEKYHEQLIKTLTNIDTSNPLTNKAALETEVLRYFYKFSHEAGLDLPHLPSNWHRAMMMSINEMTLENSMLQRGVNWPIPELVDSLALAQHYGLPTRLLDWTTSFEVALYFAAKSAINCTTQKNNPRYFGVWFAKAGTLTEIGGNKLEVVFINHQYNERLKRQHGLFTLVHGDHAELPLNKLIYNIITPDTLAPNSVAANASKQCNNKPFILLSIPVSEAAKVLSILFSKNINHASLMGSHADLAESIKERIIVQQKLEP